jgi:hypothetical protein
MKKLYTAINTLSSEVADDSTLTFTDIAKAHQAMDELTNAEIKFKCKLIFPNEKTYDSAVLALRLSDLEESHVETTYRRLHGQPKKED